MEIIPAVGEAEKLGTELLVLGVFRDGPLTGSARAVNDRAAGRLAALLARADFGETVGATRMIGPLPGVSARRLLLVGLGRAETFSDRAYRQALAAVAHCLNEDPAAEIAVTLAENEVPRRPLSWRMQQAGRILADGNYGFEPPDGTLREVRRSIMLLVPQTLTSELVGALRQGVAIGEGVSFAKELGNLPADRCTPAFIARTAEAMARRLGFSVEILGRRELEKYGLATFLAWEEAAAGACKLMLLRGERMAAGRPIILIGEGMAVRDIRSGPGAVAEGAATGDMRGIGGVLGAMRTVERLGLALNVVGLIVISQGEFPSPAGTRRAEVAQAGRPPAPERPLLGDALCYAAHLSPSCVIDVVAPSKARLAALGSHASGLFANDEALASELLACGGVSGDRVWRLPLWDDDPPPPARPGGESEQADDPPDAIAAASHLARFATAYPWAHLDISGAGMPSGRIHDATGRPVPLLAEFLIGRARMTPARPTPSHRPRTELHS